MTIEERINIASLIQQNGRLIQEVEERDQNTVSLLKQREELKTKVLELEGEKETLRKEKTYALTKVLKLEKRDENHSALLKQNEDLKAKVRVLESESSARMDEIVRLNGCLADAVAKLEDLRTRNRQLYVYQGKLKKENDDLKARDSNMAALIKQNEDLNSANRISEIVRLNGCLEDVCSASEKLESLEREVSEHVRILSDTIDLAEEKEAKLVSDISGLLGDIDVLSKCRDEKHVRILMLNDTIEELQTKCEEQAEMLAVETERTKEVHRLNARIEQLESREYRSEEIERAEYNCGLYASESQDLRNRNNELLKKIAKLKEELTATQANCEEWERQHGVLARRVIESFVTHDDTPPQAGEA